MLFWSLYAVGAATGPTILNTSGVKNAPYNVITDTNQVFNAATANHDHRVLLEGVADTGDIGGDFLTVSESDFGNFSESRVWLLRGRCLDERADTALKRRRKRNRAVFLGIKGKRKRRGFRFSPGFLAGIFN